MKATIKTTRTTIKQLLVLPTILIEKGENTVTYVFGIGHKMWEVTINQ